MAALGVAAYKKNRFDFKVNLARLTRDVMQILTPFADPRKADYRRKKS